MEKIRGRRGAFVPPFVSRIYRFKNAIRVTLKGSNWLNFAGSYAKFLALNKARNVLACTLYNTRGRLRASKRCPALFLLEAYFMKKDVAIGP